MARTDDQFRINGKHSGGGWNRKSLEEHLRDGTYRKDRHGPIVSGKLEYRKKPRGKSRAGVRSQRRWIRNASDEHAVRTGHRFNEALALHAVEFFPQFLCHSKGQWAGEAFVLNDFQIENWMYPLFGWVRPDGTRRFRRAYIEIPKKNFKSTWAAGIGIYMLLADEEMGAEVWSLGADKNQARVVHAEAVNMVEASPRLKDVTKIHHSTFNIGYDYTLSNYKAVSSEGRGKHGPSIHCAIADELHEWYGDELWNSLRYSFRARRQPLLLCITNAGADLQTICYQQHQKSEAILSGAVIDDGYFAQIMSVGRDEAEGEMEAVRNGATELPVARRCNPGIGIVIQEQDVVQDIRDAIATPSEKPNLLRLTYGVWHTGVSPWLNSDHWNQCGSDYTEEDLAGQECSAGLDLSVVSDMTALALQFRDQDAVDKYRQLVYFWMPQRTINDRQHLVDYQSWVDAGILKVCGDREMDYEILRNDLAEILDRFKVMRIAYDKMYAHDLIQWIDREYYEIDCIEMSQTLMSFAGPTAEYERLVNAGKMLHNRNPILTWQSGHAMVLTDNNRNMRPIKPKKHDIRTIDGIVAAIMALRLELESDRAESYFEEHELEIW